METTPRTIAALIIEAAKNAGADVTGINADEHGRFGFVDFTMPDGTTVRARIELDVD